MDTRIHQDASLPAALKRACGKHRLLTRTLVAAAIALGLSLAFCISHSSFAANPMAYPIQIPPPPVNPPTDSGILAPDSSANLGTPAAVPQASSPQKITLSPTNYPSKYPMSIISDGHNGAWVADEDSGLYHAVAAPAADSAPPSFNWMHLTVGEDTGATAENLYALCLDAQSRLWVGTARSGLYVLAGTHWGHYAVIADSATGAMAGPLGNHVVAIAVNPKDKSVWSCDECGVNVYDTSTNTWRYLDQQSGLPLHPNGVAFDSAGTAYVATDSDGIAISKPPYDHFRLVPGAPQLPWAGTGSGIPSGLTNAVLVTPKNQIVLATDGGLATSGDGGQSWAFERGEEFAEKIAGLYNAPRGYRAPPKAALKGLLPNDHITCLAQDTNGGGHIYAGTWSDGFSIVNESTNSQYRSTDDKTLKTPNNSNYVTAFLPIAPGQTLVGFYSGGVCMLNTPVPTTPAVSNVERPKTHLSPGGLFILPGDQPSSQPADLPAVSGVELPVVSAAELPKPPAPPTAAELKVMLKSLDKTAFAAGNNSPVVALPDDDVTRGDWLGRYGRYWACLCAMCSPDNYVWGAWADPVDFTARIGPHCRKGDSIRFWIQWLATTNPNSLEMPPTYLDSRIYWHETTSDVNRRESEMDDHSETYANTWEGPDIYFSMTIPKGQFILSLFDFNKDGDEKNRARRDFRVSIRQHASATLYDIGDFDRQPELAHTRINNFRNGVYKRFLVHGPNALTIKLERDCSFDTILCGVFLDTVDEKPAPYFKAAQTSSTAVTSGNAALNASTPVARQILNQLDQIRVANPVAWATKSRPYYAQIARWAAMVPSDAGPAKEEASRTLGTCLYHLCYYERWEQYQESQGLRTARSIEKSLRWDQQTFSYSGEEPSIIKKYLDVGSDKGSVADAPEK